MAEKLKRPIDSWGNLRIIPVDIILLLDATGANQLLIDHVKEKLTELFDKFGHERIKSFCRWRIVTFKDLEFDGPDAIDNSNPFVSKLEQLKQQFEKINCGGGGDEPESILDALYVAAQKTDWKEIGQARRFILLFTDSYPHEELHSNTIEAGADNSINAVLQEISRKRIKLYIVAPEHKIYSKLAMLPKSHYYKVEEMDNLDAFFEMLLHETQKRTASPFFVPKKI